MTHSVVFCTYVAVSASGVRAQGTVVMSLDLLSLTSAKFTIDSLVQDLMLFVWS